MALDLTETAAKAVKQHLDLLGRGLGIRLLVQTSECSGMAYGMEVVYEKQEHDLIFESHSIKIFVDPKSFAYMDGTVIDYITAGSETGFTIRNPNAKSQCGCGDSFYV